MANEQNLRPCEYKLSREEQKKGGRNSVISRRRKKNLRECAKLFSQMDCKDKDINNKLKQLGIENDDLTNAMALVVSVFSNGIDGDVRAAKLYSDWCDDGVVDTNENAERDPLSAAMERLGG